MESNFKKTVDSLFTGMENFLTTKTVVGEAIHIDDTIILPLVDVSFGVGAGASDGKEDKKSSGGGGLGAKITPSAILVIQNGQTKLVNVKDQDNINKIIEMVPDLMEKINLKSKKKEENEEE
ncbi:putative spore protein YtfJ [Natranaerovirga hydrolytica]|uniref:Putative spore protein YtfJ n=1 Tax=Natranaerovirga hydrolytica TaxID=680378 RepID=A0A4V2Q1J4_9FIRM|nr:GerW family sporulation protein [Natranaerovirga hydrolytica]TCK97851.1 putative spore protein YtfJ [Natranaerovirga hydrolytica]